MADIKPIALWAVPRSISTAFERAFVERDDFEVFHEPFSASYYYSEDRMSDRYAEEEPDPAGNYERVLAEVSEPRPDGERVFVKDMAYHAKGLMDREGVGFVSRFVNTFIVRDPKYVLAYLHKMWPDATFEEAGYEQLYRLFRLATRAGQEPVVVDAMTFSENPVGVLSAYCERVGIAFDPTSLSWEAKDVKEWDSWEGWHEEAERSTGIQRAERKDPALPEELSGIYDRCLPAYYALAAKAIPATTRRP